MQVLSHLSRIFCLQPKGQNPSRPDLMTLAAQRMQQPLSPGLLAAASVPGMNAPPFGPAPYGTLSGQAPQPSQRPDLVPYPSTSYNYPFQQGYDGYGSNFNNSYIDPATGSPLAHQQLPFGLSSAALADMSSLASLTTLPQQSQQPLYEQQSHALYTSHLRPTLPPSQMLLPNAYQQKPDGTQQFALPGDATFAYPQLYSNAPATGSF